MDTAMDADAALGEGAGADGRRARRVAGGGEATMDAEDDDGDDGGGEAVDGGDAQGARVQARRGAAARSRSARGYQLTRVNVRDVSGGFTGISGGSGVWRARWGLPRPSRVMELG